MRKRLFATALVSLLAACLSTYPRQRLVDDNPRIEQVVEVPGLLQAQIYSAAVLWMQERFKGTKFDYENQSGGSFAMKLRKSHVCLSYSRDAAGNPTTSCAFGGYDDIVFTMHFEARDGRYKITYINIAKLLPNGKGGIVETRLSYQDELDALRPKLLEDLNANIQASVGNKSKW